MLRRSFRSDIRPFSRLLKGVSEEVSTVPGLQERTNESDVHVNRGRVESALPCKLDESSSYSEAIEFLDEKDSGMLLWFKN